MSEFDYTKSYEDTVNGVSLEFKNKVSGMYTVRAGHGDYLDLKRAFLFECGVAKVGLMTPLESKFSDFNDNGGLSYIYFAVKHKIGEEDFRELVKKYRAIVKEFEKRYAALKEGLEVKNRKPSKVETKVW